MVPIIRKLVLSFALFLAVLATGCTDAETPLAAVPAGPSLSSSEVGSLARFRQRPQATVAWARKSIGPRGGRLDFMGFAIEVPPGAVDRVTTFSIRLPVEPHTSDRVLAEFGPHNRRFARPVAIELPLRGTSIEASAAPTIVWWNATWVDVGATVTPDGKRLRTLTDHFSTYGTTETRGGTMVTSGG